MNEQEIVKKDYYVLVYIFIFVFISPLVLYILATEFSLNIPGAKGMFWLNAVFCPIILFICGLILLLSNSSKNKIMGIIVLVLDIFWCIYFYIKLASAF